MDTSVCVSLEYDFLTPQTKKTQPKDAGATASKWRSKDFIL